MRLFVGIELAPALVEELVGAIATLKRTWSEQVRFVDPENLHLTLKFIGSYDPGLLSTLELSLAKICQSMEQTTLTLTSAGCFPLSQLNNSGCSSGVWPVRIIWVGLAAQEALSQCAQALEHGLVDLGITKEEREFLPYITLGRVNPKISPFGEIFGCAGKDARANTELCEVFGARRRLPLCRWQS